MYILNKIIKLIFLFSIFGFTDISFSQTGWYSINSGTATTLNKIQFVNPRTGWAGGHQAFPTYYNLIKTTNAGETWFDQRPNFPYGNRVISLFFLNENTGWVTGADGFFKTTNGGNNYSALNGYTVNDCHFVNDMTGWILCVPVAPQLMKTTDGGTAFNAQSVNIGASEQLSSIRFVNLSTGWCVGNNYIFKTTNGGDNWISQSHPFCQSINCIYALSSEIAWVSADSGKVLSTTNGGANWIAKNIAGNYLVSSVYFINSYTGYASTYPRNIFKTTDNGLNWYPQMTDTASIFFSISFTSDDTGYVCGSLGRIYKTTTGGGTIGIKQISGIIPESYLLYQCYPNPFNPSTTIRYDLPKNSFVKLVVFDALGKEIVTLVNEKQSTGTYEAVFDASYLPSGIYFYLIETDDFTDTKRMLFIK